jgi:FKBP-type peptidyl-prolyl cis-trans isomerase
MIKFINYIFVVLCPYIYYILLSHKAKEKTKKHKKIKKKKQRNTKKANIKKTQKKQKEKTKKHKKQNKKKQQCYFIPSELHPKFARDKLIGGSKCLIIPGEP